MDRLVKHHVTRQVEGDDTGRVAMLDMLQAPTLPKYSPSVAPFTDSPLSTPLVVDTNTPFPAYQHSPLTSPAAARIASLGSPVSPSWQRPQGAGSLPLRSPKRTISFEFPSDLSPDQIAHIHRQVTEMASAAGTADSVKITEGMIPEVEDLPILQLQAPPKAKVKRQLSIDSSPPQSFMCPADRSLQHASSREVSSVSQGSFFASTSTAAEPELCGVTAALISQPIKCLVPDSTVPLELSRSQMGRELLGLTPDTMSPKRLRSEHGSVPCTPSRSLQPGDPNKDTCSSPQAGGHASTPRTGSRASTPKSAKRSKESDIVFVFPELHGNEDINDDDAAVDDICSVLPKEVVSENLTSPLSCTKFTHNDSYQSSRSSPAEQHYDVKGLSILQVESAQASLAVKSSFVPTTENRKIDTADQASLTRPLKERPDDSSTITSRLHSHSEGKNDLQRKTAELFEWSARMPSILSQNTAERKVLKTSISDSVISEVQHRKGSDPGRARPHERHFSNVSMRGQHEQWQQSPSYVSPDPPQKVTQNLITAVPSKRNRLSYGCESDKLHKDITVSPSSNQSVKNTENSSSSASSSFTHTTAQVMPSTCGDNHFLADAHEPESGTALLCQSKVNPFTFTTKDIEKARVSQSEPLQDFSSKAQRVDHSSQQDSGLSSPRFTDSPYQAEVIQLRTSSQCMPDVAQADLIGEHWGSLDSSRHLQQSGRSRVKAGKPAAQENAVFYMKEDNRSQSIFRSHRSEGAVSDVSRARERMTVPRDVALRYSGNSPDNRPLVRQMSDSPKTDQHQLVFPGDQELFFTHNYRAAPPAEYPTPSVKDAMGKNVAENQQVFREIQSGQKMIVQASNSYEAENAYYTQSSMNSGGAEEKTAILQRKEDNSAREQSPKRMVTTYSHRKGRQPWFDPAKTIQQDHSGYLPFQPHLRPFPCSSTGGHYEATRVPECFAESVGVGASPRHLRYEEQQTVAHGEEEDDTVFFECCLQAAPDVYGQPGSSSSPQQRRNPFTGATPWPQDLISEMQAHFTPKSRPTLRSHSNVEQSPNQAELEEMAPFKYLRSYSEHITDPAYLVKQRRALSDSCNKRPVERLSSCEGAARPAWRIGPEPRPMTERGSGGARRQLFTEVRHLQSPEGGNMRLFTYTPLLRSHSFSYAHPPRIRNRYSSASDDNRNSREPGDLDVRVECFSATPSGEWRVPEHEANPRSAICRRIDLHIQNILESHRQMRPSTNTYGELDRWRSQEAEVLRLTEEASCLIDKLSEHHRVVYDVTNGSVLIRINCQTLLGVLDLWQLYQSGTLHGLVNELFGGDKLLDDLQVRDAMFRVRVCPRQYKQCLQELGSSVLLYLQPSTTSRPLNIIKKASSCSSAENILTTAPCSPASGRFSQSAHVLSTSSPAATSSWNTKSPSTPPWNTKSPSTPPWNTKSPSTPPWNTKSPSTPPWNTKAPSTPPWNTKSPSTPPWNTKSPSTPPWNTKAPSTPPWNARSSTPTSREGKFLYGDLVPRKAFSELNLSDGEAPASPTKKKSSFDSLSQKENSCWSPLPSPRLCTTASQGRRRKADTDCEESSENMFAPDVMCHAQQLPTDQ